MFYRFNQKHSVALQLQMS